MGKLLIAIDSQIIATRLASALPRYEVHICHNGLQALDMLHTLRPDGLVIDLSLWGIDGLTVLRETRYLPPAILALTTLADRRTLDAAAKAGAQDAVLLPCAFDHLMKHVEKVLCGN